MAYRAKHTPYRGTLMRKIWIIGNSGAARECYWIYRDMCSANADLEKSSCFEGFLSWHNYPSDLRGMEDLFRGDVDSFGITPECEFVIGIGHPALRAEVFDLMKKRGARFFTLVHPWSDTSHALAQGEANIFQRGCSIFCDAQIGNANYFNGSVTLSHDVCVGDANFFGPFALLLGGCTVGSRNMVAVKTTILANARVGNDNMLAPGCFVYKGCGNGVRMAGNPAVKIGKVEHSR